MKVLIGPTPALADALPELQQEFPQVQFESFLTVSDMGTAIADADAYVGLLSRDLFLAAKRLKWIQSPSTGVDFYFTIPELVTSDVRLTSARGTHTACVAESALAMILAFTRGIREAIFAQQRHEWRFFEIRQKVVELTGSTMGIIGFGAIGRAIAKRAHAFDVRIVAVDVAPGDKPDYVAELWAMDHLEELLRCADYVVVTVPRTPQTLDMIGPAQLAQMKSTAILVGISRGGIINERALAQALREQRIAAAALDVLDPEPPAEDSELWDLPNLLLTPHIAGGTQFEAQHLLAIFRENLHRFLRGEFPLHNEVDKLLGY